MYCVPSDDGGVALGSRPSNARCVGVRGMSVSSSLARVRGRRAIEMLYRRTREIDRTRGVMTFWSDWMVRKL